MMMLVIRPAMLFRKFGLPQAIISRSILPENRGFTNFKSAFPRKKGT